MREMCVGCQAILLFFDWIARNRNAHNNKNNFQQQPTKSKHILLPAEWSDQKKTTTAVGEITFENEAPETERPFCASI